MFKLHFGLVVVVSVWGICAQSQPAVLDIAKVKQTSDWQCDMFCEHRPTVNYTSQNNCSIYSPMICCCFLPVESHSSRTYRVCAFPYKYPNYTTHVCVAVCWFLWKFDWQMTLSILSPHCMMANVNISALTATWNPQHNFSSVVSICSSQPLLFSECNILLILKPAGKEMSQIIWFSKRHSCFSKM